MKYNQNNCFCFVYYNIFTSLLYCTNFKYLYFIGVVLFWKTYFTTFKIIILYFLLYFISHVIVVSRVFNDLFFFLMSLLNQFTNLTERFISKLDWVDCSCSRVKNVLIQMIRSERVSSLPFTESTSLTQSEPRTGDQKSFIVNGNHI